MANPEERGSVNAISLAGRWVRAESGVGPELGRPPLGFGVLDDPDAAEFFALEVAALDFTLDGVTCRGGHCGDLDSGEHLMTVTRLRNAVQPR